MQKTVPINKFGKLIRKPKCQEQNAEDNLRTKMQQCFDSQETQGACGRKHGGKYSWTNKINWSHYFKCEPEFIPFKKSLISKKGKRRRDQIDSKQHFFPIKICQLIECKTFFSTNHDHVFFRWELCFIRWENVF